MSIHTVNSSSQCLGWVTVHLTIDNNYEKVNLFVIENANYSLILGLDLIKLFKLSLSDDLRIFQWQKINNKNYWKIQLNEYGSKDILNWTQLTYGFFKDR